MFRNKSKSRSIVSETKLDDSFPTKQFVMSGFYKPYRLDRCSNGGFCFMLETTYHLVYLVSIRHLKM